MNQFKQQQLTQVPKLLKQQLHLPSQEQLEDLEEYDDETDSSQFIVVDPSVLLDYPEES